MGLQVPATVQGKDLSRAILKRRDDAVESVPLFFFNPSWRGVYTHDFTYGHGVVEHYTLDADGRLLLREVPVRALYDRRNDPFQLNNLFGTSGASTLQKEMERLTRNWMDRFGDRGATPEEIKRAYGYADGTFPEDTREERFKGRPVDVV
jgi:hypothetical protein